MKRTALKILIGSVVVSALLGIWALLVGDMGELQVKVLLTSLCISGASILSMACSTAWERGPWPQLPRIGMGLAIGGFGYLIVLIWAEADGEGYWKTAATLLILATAAAHAALVGLARLKARHAWLVPATWFCAAALALLLIGAIWEEWEDENVWRWVGVLSILLSAGTILVPVFQRIARADAPPVLDRVRFCPGCGKGLDAPYGDVACPACGLTARIERPGGLPDQTVSGSSSSSTSS